jgi:hypothetical protein
MLHPTVMTPLMMVQATGTSTFKVNVPKIIKRAYNQRTMETIGVLDAVNNIWYQQVIDAEYNVCVMQLSQCLCCIFTPDDGSKTCIYGNLFITFLVFLS